jgi:hypothetical protein
MKKEGAQQEDERYSHQNINKGNAVPKPKPMVTASKISLKG